MRASGVLIAQAGRFGGWSLYLKEGKPTFLYNFLGMKQFKICGQEPVPDGSATICFDFAYDGGGAGKGATGTLSVNGKRVAH